MLYCRLTNRFQFNTEKEMNHEMRWDVVVKVSKSNKLEIES